jgi:hypothetical protein
MLAQIDGTALVFGGCPLKSVDLPAVPSLAMPRFRDTVFALSKNAPARRNRANSGNYRLYSITSSARPSSESGTVRPSALAVLGY